MKMRMLAGTALGVAMTLASVSAQATVYVPDESEMLPAATPGIALGVGSMITTIGAATDLDSPEPSVAWAAASIVFGSLSIVSGAIYAGVSAEHSDNARHVFIPTAVGNLAFGTSSLALGITVATLVPDALEMPIRPELSFDAEGRPFASISGTF